MSDRFDLEWPDPVPGSFGNRVLRYELWMRVVLPIIDDVDDRTLIVLHPYSRHPGVISSLN